MCLSVSGTHKRKKRPTWRSNHEHGWKQTRLKKERWKRKWKVLHQRLCNRFRVVQAIRSTQSTWISGATRLVTNEWVKWESLNGHDEKKLLWNETEKKVKLFSCLTPIWLVYRLVTSYIKSRSHHLLTQYFYWLV